MMIDTMAACETESPLLDVRGLRVILSGGRGDIVSDIGFTVAAGEIVGLVGESGSGKSTIASALLGYARPGAQIADGAVMIAGQDILRLSASALRAARGTLVSHIAQDPAMALNPSIRIGAHLDELLCVHAPAMDRRTRAERITTVLQEVGLPTDALFLRRFAHQLSGGQQQRVLLALGFILQPRLIVLDEPTTALDVTTQAQVLDTIRRLCRDRGIAAIYVSHDMAVVRALADRVVVLYAGRIVEAAPAETLFAAPRHPYTRGLLASIPVSSVRRQLLSIEGHAPAPTERKEGCLFAPRCPNSSARCAVMPLPSSMEIGGHVACHHPVDGPLAIAGSVNPVLPSPTGTQPLLALRGATAAYGTEQILFGVDMDLHHGTCTALVGESGSGKTTLARALVGLGENVAGALTFQGQVIDMAQSGRDAVLRRHIQYVFQNPFRALNPRQTVKTILVTAVRHFFRVSRQEAEKRVVAALDHVALPPAVLSRYPRDLSGGERQRVAIARALVCEPEILICDEITSALDVSVQATILNLLNGLQQKGLTILFVTHDLAVVRAIADHVIVLKQGHVIESGTVGEVLDAPTTPYTRDLVSHTPRLGLSDNRPLSVELNG